MAKTITVGNETITLPEMPDGYWWYIGYGYDEDDYVRNYVSLMSTTTYKRRFSRKTKTRDIAILSEHYWPSDGAAGLRRAFENLADGFWKREEAARVRAEVLKVRGEYR